MRYIAILITCLLSGCSFLGLQNPLDSIQNRVLQPIEARVLEDLIQIGKIGEIVQRPEITQCANYLQTLSKTVNSSNETIAKLQAEDTSGKLISSVLKNYFIAEMQHQSGQTAIADFQKNFPIQCGAVNSVVQAKVMEQAIFGATRGGSGFILGRP